MRINQLISLIDSKKNTIVDVGSDHAYLSKLIINNDLANKVINIEKNYGPLINSINNTKDVRYLSRIYNVESDGLVNINSSLFIDICFICGMGGKTISEILDSSKHLNINQFILQPNNNEQQIRKWVRINNWRINKELIIEDNGIYYEIIILDKNNGYIPFWKEDEIYGKLNIKMSNDIFFNKWDEYFNNHKEIINTGMNTKLNKIYKIYKRIKDESIRNSKYIA